MKLGEVIGYEEIAALLLVPVRTLRLWRAAGEMPPGKKIGRRRLWSRTDIVRWLTTQSAGKMRTRGKRR
jgi:excisionase family DNA binding protein